MIAVRNVCPVNYRLCNQTVTVYRKEEDSYSRTVYRNAFFDFRKTQNVDKTGSREESSFLLVIPGAQQTVFPGDKVLVGEGEEIRSREEWAKLIPARVPGLVVVSCADPKYWRGKIVHTEASG